MSTIKIFGFGCANNINGIIFFSMVLDNNIIQTLHGSDIDIIVYIRILYVYIYKYIYKISFCNSAISLTISWWLN